jgi:hypothetical protein
MSERRSGLLPALGLAVLAPLIGEYLLGNISIRELPALPFLVPMYGGGALLIREVARRTGRGWVTILILGAAYGVLEPGIFDGSLFNPSFEGLDFTAGYVPALGFSPYYLVHFAVGHAVWSITIPIVLVEALAPGRRATPWLGNVGLAVTAIAYLAGGLLIQVSMRDSGDYHTSAVQFIGTVLGAAALAVVALWVGGRSPAKPADATAAKPVDAAAAKPAPRPLVVGVGGFVGSSVFFATPEGWWGLAACVVIIVVAAVVVARLSRRPGWQQDTWWLDPRRPEIGAPGRHWLALASGVLFTYAWGGFVLTWLKYRMDPVSYAGNVVFALGAFALVTAAWRCAGTAGSRAAELAAD